MAYNIILPSQIWQDYDVSSPEFNERIIDEENDGQMNVKTYQITALTDSEEALRVTVNHYTALNDSDYNLLIVPEYDKMPSRKFIQSLLSSGFNLIVPDIAGNDEPPTVFPKRYFYGKYTEAGDNIKKVMPTALDTCQYLYSVIVKRVIHFARTNLMLEKLVLVGLGDAVEVAMQVAGSGTEVDALACINSAGYREYIRLNKYGGGKELILDEERISWLSGVASVAYAKYVTCPVFIAIGTNSEKSDIDRVNNLAALLPDNNLITSFSPKAADFMLPDSYSTLKIWLKHMMDKDVFPTAPVVELKVDEEGKIYAYVDIDPCSMIENVEVYFSYGEYNHEIRNWLRAEGFSVSFNEYLATLEVSNAEAPLFAFAKVKYENGITLTSLEQFLELKGQSVKAKPLKSSRIIYQPSQGISGFIECCKDEVLTTKGLNMETTPLGACGISAVGASLKTYQIDIETVITDERMLQIDLFSLKSTTINVYLQEKTEEGIKKYIASVNLNDTKGFFIGTKFKQSDFKDKRLMSLDSWKNICSLEVEGQDVIIGNILFI